jgi:cobalt-zinc-cadmium resistance protein CzcA
MDEKLILPVGYSISYGGQFENLENARKRLAIAVPVSLALIFIMLYFAFSSIREALLIFTAIPLSAVGGVWLLWLRGMPFSISAGIGFIALFGISVLNGIVLMEHFKSLKRSDFNSWEDLIIQGTRDRIRAVVLTASAAALGFLPMAVSTSAGAEVQRPLATVVIGGLITATLLTLVVIPILYSVYKSRGKFTRSPRPSNLGLLLVLLLPGWSNQAAAQNENIASDKKWNLSELTLRALEEHPDARMASWEINRTRSARSSAWSLDKTQIFFGYDQNNLAANNVPLRVWGVSQSMEFPTRYFARAGLRDSEYELARKQFELSAQTIRQGVALAYYDYLIARKRNQLLSRLDSLYERFDYAARRRYELGETNYLEQLSAQSQKRKISLALRKSNTSIEQAMASLKYWARSEEALHVAETPVLKYPFSALDWESNPLSAVSERRVRIREKEWALAKQSWLPDLHFTYFQGSNPGLNDQIFGYQLGVSLPIFFTGRASEVKQARFSAYKAQEEYERQRSLYERSLGQSLSELRQQQEALDYYEKEGNALSAEILRTATSSYRQGEIDFFQYILALTNGIEIQLEYLDVLEAYNRTAIQLTFMTP